MIRLALLLLAAASLAVAFAAAPLAGGRQALLYVDDDAPPGGDGLTWPTAFRHLQDALNQARLSPEVTEIRVAQGVYKPDQGQGIQPGDRNAAFDLVNFVRLGGGYSGLGGADPDERDVQRFEAVLSGDLLGNDAPGFVNYNDNSYRVVRATNLDGSTVIEGVTITASERNISDALVGGGIFCSQGGLTIQYCRFERNRAYQGGGLGLIISAHADVRNCQFVQNSATDGAGGYIRSPPPQGSILIEDCLFQDNIAFHEDGGALNLGGDDIIRRCTFLNNRADDGGAITGGPRVEDSIFIGNTADYGGAAGRGDGDYVRCWFQNNHASSSGGAYGTVIETAEFHSSFIDCTFVGNTSSGNAGGASYGGEAFINCRFLNNRSGVGNGGPFAPGGAIHAHAATLIIGCSFSASQSSGAGGAVSVHSKASASIINSSFANNASGGVGAAVSGPATIINSVFGSHPTPPVVGATSITYSLLPQSMAGTGNVIGDPLFVNPLGPDGVAGTEDDDLRLRADSPCIDAADTTALPADQFDLDGDGDTAEPLPLDAFGNCRVLETPAVANTGIPSTNGTAVVDMGAHEYRRPADIAPDIGDGVVDIDDLIAVIVHWGPCAPPDDPALPSACIADIDGNGEVAVSDLVTVILSWG